MKRVRMISIIVVTAVLLMGTFYVAFARSKTNSGVLPPTSKVQGLTYGQWLAKWWEYALTMPASQNPLSGTTGVNCMFQRIGKVGLVVVNSTQDEPIQCEVPAGIKLFFEVLGAECSTLEEPPFYGGNEAELIACAQAFVPQELEASIDGIEVQNLSQYIVLSPLYEFTNPEDNILGVPSGSVGESVGSGAYLMLAPLSPGEHTLHLHGTYPELEYTADRVVNLTVKH